MALHSDDEYEVKSAADTLISAEEIKLDKKMYKKALAEVKNRKKAIGKINT